MEFKKIWKYHLLVIVIVLLMGFWNDYYFGGIDRLKDNFKHPIFLFFLISKLVFFIIYFLNFYWLSPRTLKGKKIIHFSIGALLLLVAFAVLRYFLEEVVLFKITGLHNYSDEGRSNLLFYFFDNTFFSVKSVLYSTSLYLFFQFSENKNKMHQLEIDHKKAEVSYLKSQISPHFLFNTLNAFYVELIDDKPETAKDIHKLSQLLRFVTYEAQADFLPLENEIGFLKDYIYFYHKRYEDQLFVDFNIEGLVNGKQIPSLILIHFIENVFKHGTINDKNNPAKINLIINENYLILQTENKFIASEKYSHKGIGKSNIQRRLTAIYKTNFELNYQTKNDYFSTYLKIPLNV
jgi:sensor histidine kinase YesM